MVEFQVVRGDDKTWTFTFVDSDGNAIDITGYIFFFTVKSRSQDTDAEAIISKDITILSDPTNGIMQVSVTNSETSINVGSYRFDLQWKDTSDKIKTVTGPGDFVVLQDISTRTA